jgi:hypothetical protein
MKPQLPQMHLTQMHRLHMKPHTRHVLLACILALVLLTVPAEVLSRVWSTVEL